MLIRSLVATAVIGIAPFAITYSSTAEQQEQPHVRGFLTEHLAVAQPSDENSVYVYSPSTSGWSSHSFPEHLEVQPVLSSNLLAFSIKGEGITELVVADRTGRWHTQRLTAPTDKWAAPYVTDEIVAYAVGDTVYAFSARAGRWDTATIGNSSITINSNMALATSSDRAAVFSAVTGRWLINTPAPN